MIEKRRGRPRKKTPGVDKKQQPDVLSPTERQRLFRARMEAEGNYHLSTWVKEEVMAWLKDQAMEREISVGDVINEVVTERIKKKGSTE
ncbi:hypothetical protein [Leptospirillum ferriphilum]|uniref:Uncharacterized protein n=1 Tax=Leptospirillum ferriphilum TaxID=178606 RepID=A0A1V3SUZ8_9BACT|nr:hypothetical protein [Leptospirillum ferriphilum]OOH72643.1 hypothetical protein BOX24_06495 [Leptospirillum ferriphilum]